MTRIAQQQRQEARGVLMFVNRTAGSGKGRAVVDQVKSSLTARGYTTDILSDLGELREQAAERFASGELRAVLSAGGDGTFGAVLNATPRGTPLAVLPMGTENLLAKYLKHKRSAASIIRVIDEGVVAPLDAARAGDRLFSMMLSAGFDAEVVHRVHGARRGNITRLAYAPPIFRSLSRYRFPRMKASWAAPDGQTETVESRWSFVMNLPNYALGLPVSPNASGTDGQLDLCLFQQGSMTTGLWYLWHVLRRRHEQLDSVTAARTSSLRLEAVDEEEVPYQIDGDPGGHLPVDVETVPARMNLIVDCERAECLGFELPNQRD